MTLEIPLWETSVGHPVSKVYKLGSSMFFWVFFTKHLAGNFESGLYSIQPVSQPLQ